MSNGGEQNSFPVKTKVNAMTSPSPFLSVKPTCSIPICRENCRLDKVSSGYFVYSHDPLCRHQYSNRNDKTHFYWLLVSFSRMTRGWLMLVCYPSTFHHLAVLFLFFLFSTHQRWLCSWICSKQYSTTATGLPEFHYTFWIEAYI